jgi:hypothetical protein
VVKYVHHRGMQKYRWTGKVAEICEKLEAKDSVEDLSK